MSYHCILPTEHFCTKYEGLRFAWWLELAQRVRVSRQVLAAWAMVHSRVLSQRPRLKWLGHHMKFGFGYKQIQHVQGHMVHTLLTNAEEHKF